MKISDIYDELSAKSTIAQLFKMLGATIAVVMLGIYIGNIFFGVNSLEVYLNLVDYKKELETRIEDLKEENAQLQKEYFELKQLEPQE